MGLNYNTEIKIIDWYYHIVKHNFLFVSKSSIISSWKKYKLYLQIKSCFWQCDSAIC
jgi:hypothetical protein